MPADRGPRPRVALVQKAERRAESSVRHAALVPRAERRAESSVRRAALVPRAERHAESSVRRAALVPKAERHAESSVRRAGLVQKAERRAGSSVRLAALGPAPAHGRPDLPDPRLAAGAASSTIGRVAAGRRMRSTGRDPSTRSAGEAGIPAGRPAATLDRLSEMAVGPRRAASRGASAADRAARRPTTSARFRRFLLILVRPRCASCMPPTRAARSAIACWTARTPEADPTCAIRR
jgi:hypothetical protein